MISLSFGKLFEKVSQREFRAPIDEDELMRRLGSHYRHWPMQCQGVQPVPA
jgi:hypothetical protein